MPISLNITQPTGVVATYHKVTAYSGGDTNLIASVYSYLSQEAFAAGDQPISTQGLDVGAILSQPATNPSAGATIKDVVFGILENALISIPQGPFTGGTIVS